MPSPSPCQSVPPESSMPSSTALALIKRCTLSRIAGDIVRAQSGVMHGKTSPVTHIDAGVLQGLAMCVPLNVFARSLPPVIPQPGTVPWQ